MTLTMSGKLLLLLAPVMAFASNRDFRCDVSDRSASPTGKTQTINILRNETKSVSLEDGKHSLGFNNYDGELLTSFYEPGHQDAAIWISLEGRGLVLRLKKPLIQVYCRLQ